MHNESHHVTYLVSLTNPQLQHQQMAFGLLTQQGFMNHIIGSHGHEFENLPLGIRWKMNLLSRGLVLVPSASPYYCTIAHCAIRNVLGLALETSLVHTNTIGGWRGPFAG